MLRRGDESIRHGSDRLEAKRAGYCPIVFGGGVVPRGWSAPQGHIEPGAVSRVVLPRLDMAHA